jgi:hypothetical protein
VIVLHKGAHFGTAARFGKPEKYAQNAHKWRNRKVENQKSVSLFYLRRVRLKMRDAQKI